MEMFVKKLAFLLVFTAVLFLAARILEFIAWYETGLLVMKLVDPVSLSVKKLKSILDGRGLSYEGVVDKAELTHLVKSSGEVVEGEVLMLEETGAEDDEMTTKFSSKAQFDEEVEDKKDSVWLVQVVPKNHGPLLGRKAWSTVVKKLSRFGIRHGTFDCSIDPRICAQKNWNLPLLLLAMPQGHRHKDHVTMATFTSAGKAHQIIKWVNTQLANKVKMERIKNTDLVWDLLEKDDSVKMVLFSETPEPPVFFSALNLKYSGRVKFLFVRVGEEAGLPHSSSNQFVKCPAYFIVTPEGKRIYGRKSGEYYTYKAMDIYLQTITPEANDIFIFSFMYVNAICFLGLFVVQGGLAKRVFTFVWTIGKYNFTFLLLWLPLLGLLQLPFMSFILDLSYKVIRYTAETSLLGKLRQDWLMYSNHSYTILALFLLYCVFVNWASKKIQRSTSEDNMTSTMWLRSSWLDLNNFLFRPSPSFLDGRQRNDHLEEGLATMFDQMAFPDLWLHPTIPTEYIHDLTKWKYTCHWLQNQSSSNDYDSTDSEKGKCHKVNCPKLHKYLLNSSCKVEYGSRVQGSDVAMAHGSDDAFFAVSSQEKPVCLQPETSSQIDSVILSAHSVANLEKDNNHEGKEANVQVNDPHSEKIKPDPKNCSRCTCDPSSSSTQVMPDNLGAKSINSMGDEDKVTDDFGQPSKRHSPKRKIKVGKSKPNSKKETNAQMVDTWPEGFLFNSQCAICLDAYTHGITVCGLPCGHAYHQQCIVAWLQSGNHMCPICRWPAYKKKGCKLSKHME